MGRETSITVQMDTEEFTATGLMILEKNWLEIYAPWERWSTGQGELPPCVVGSRVEPSSLMMKEGRTSAPQLISEVELISLMDRNGIGTDATIATHISTIQNREYATKDNAQRFAPTPLGIALVEGYNQMGYQLNKPDLRREMEHECNLVASQQKTKDDIIGPILEKMRQCYLTATAEAQKLDDAVGRHFPRLGAANDNNMQVLNGDFSECGSCQGRLVLKAERRGGNRGGGGEGRGGGNPRKVLYCNTCQEGWPLPRGQLRPKTEQENGGGNPVKCPICNYQVVRVERGDGYEGNGYHFCPKCFTDSPQDHGGNPNAGEFRCFTCTHPTCALAGGTRGGDVEIFACPFCREQGNQSGKVTLRKNSRSYVLSCSNYSSRSKCAYTIWLPKESQEVSVVEGDASTCARCSNRGPVRKLSFTWKPGSVPPHLGRDCTVCILCDVTFRQDMQVSLPQRNQVATNNRQPRPRTGGGRVAPQGNVRNPTGGGGGGNVCYRCGQPGHFANNCPRNP
jgi:DNA topoisomerase-3